MTDELIYVNMGDRIDVYQSGVNKQIFKIEKKGDHSIGSMAASGEYLAYSDAVDTQIFHIDIKELKITKLTKKICVQNNISALPPCHRLKFTTDFSK